jgi:hypothetical protein
VASGLQAAALRAMSWMSDVLSALRRPNGGAPSFPGLPSPDGLPGMPLPPAAPTVPVSPTSLSPGGGGGLPSQSLAATAPNSQLLSSAARSRLRPPPFWSPAVVVSLIERPG